MSVDKSSRAKTTMTLVSKQDAKVDTHVMLYDQWKLNSLLFWRKKAFKVELFCPSLQLYSGRESFKRGKFLWWAISIPFYHENREKCSRIRCLSETAHFSLLDVLACLVLNQTPIKVQSVAHLFFSSRVFRNCFQINSSVKKVYFSQHEKCILE